MDFSHCICTTVLHDPWSAESMYVEPQIRKADYKVIHRFSTSQGPVPLTLCGSRVNHSYIHSDISIAQKSDMGLTGLSPRCEQGCIFFWRVQERRYFLAFSSFLRPPPFLGLWTLSSIFKDSDVAFLKRPSLCAYICLWLPLGMVLCFSGLMWLGWTHLENPG